MVFSKQFPKTITTSKTFISDEPDFSVSNPLKKNVFCNGIEVVCSPEFTRKGAVVIKVDGITQFDSRNSDGFKRVGKLPITLNTPMKRDVIVDVFAFNEVDSDEISCTVTVFLSEESKNLDSSLQYISDDVVNSLVSESEILFPVEIRVAAEYLKLLNMKGYKKLIVTMTESTPVLPISVEVTQPFLQTPMLNVENSIDGKFDTQTGTASPTDSNSTTTSAVTTTFADNSVKGSKIQFNVTQTAGSGTRTATLLTSLDDITYTAKDSKTFSSPQSATLDGGTHAYKFMRIEFFQGVGVSFLVNIVEMYDNLIMGGSGLLDFEVLDVASNKWQLLIPSSEFGTISDGDVTITTQIGDVNSGISFRKNLCFTIHSNRI